VCKNTKKSLFFKFREGKNASHPFPPLKKNSLVENTRSAASGGHIIVVTG